MAYIIYIFYINFILILKNFLRFDQKLNLALKVIDKSSTFGQLMSGQLYFHIAVFLLQNTEKVSIFKLYLRSLSWQLGCINFLL